MTATDKQAHRPAAHPANVQRGEQPHASFPHRAVTIRSSAALALRAVPVPDLPLVSHLPPYRRPSLGAERTAIDPELRAIARPRPGRLLRSIGTATAPFSASPSFLA